MINIEKVLLVDDDPEWLEFLIQTVGSEYSVTTATSGDEAMRKIAKDKPDAVITDVMMPGGKDGFTLFAELKSREQYRNLPVIMLTEINQKTGLAFNSTELKKYLGRRPASFLEKPVSGQQLLDEIEAVKQS